MTPPRRAGLPLQGAGAFSLFLVYWLEDLEGSTSHTCMCVHLRRAEMRSYLSKEAGGSGDHHQMAVGRLWSANSEFTLSSRRAACLWGCRLRRLLAAGSTCLVCTPWFQPPWKLGPGLVGLSSTTPRPACSQARLGHLAHPSSALSNLRSRPCPPPLISRILLCSSGAPQKWIGKQGRRACLQLSGHTAPQRLHPAPHFPGRGRDSHSSQKLVTS